MIDRKRIYGTFDVLKAAKERLHAAAETEIVLKWELENARLQAIAGGQIVGKNETEREAKARELLAPQYQSLDDAQRVARHARLALELAQLDAEALRMEMRLAELEAAALSLDTTAYGEL